MSLSMFTSIPLPFSVWDDSAINLVLPFMPFVGALLGGIWFGIAALLNFLNLSVILTAGILTVLPFLLTGFIHLDGYMDTSDSVLSRRSLEEKFKILKDPHVGSFAVIMIIILFLLQFTAVYEIISTDKNIIVLIFIPIFSRCCSATASMRLKAMRQSEYVNMFKKNTDTSHIIFIIITAIAALVLAFFTCSLTGLISVLITIIGFIISLALVYRVFGGISGDLAGFSLTVAELVGLLTYAIIA